MFKSIFVPILTYGHESWVMTEKVQLQMKASEIKFLQKIKGVTMFDKHVRCFTNIVTLRFLNLLTLSRYFSKSKDLSFDGLVVM